jgi:hypothetical protein
MEPAISSVLDAPPPVFPNIRSAAVPGTPAGLQLAPTDQLPPAALFQVAGAAWVDWADRKPATSATMKGGVERIIFIWVVEERYGMMMNVEKYDLFNIPLSRGATVVGCKCRALLPARRMMSKPKAPA